jgi:hypothetical protein
MSIPTVEICVVCGKPVKHDNAHYFHLKNCGYEKNGVCYCDNPCHPECCPDCNKDLTTKLIKGA